MGFVVRRLLPVLFLSAPLIACATPAHDDRIAAASPALNDLTSFALMRIDQGARSSAVLSVEQFADALKDYDVVFFGEWHDHPGNHLADAPGTIIRRATVPWWNTPRKTPLR